MELILLVLLWLPLCIAVWILAHRYNRIGFGWFLLSVFLTPLLGFAFVLALGPKAKVDASAKETPKVPELTGWRKEYLDKYSNHYR